MPLWLERKASYDCAMRRFLFIVMLFAGCPPNPQMPPPGPAFDEAACAEFVVPHRMGLRWRLLNHRVSTWSVRLDRDDCLADTLEVTSIGGDFSTGETADDQPSLAYAFRRVKASPEELGVARVSIETEVGPDDREEGTVDVDRAKLNLRNYPHVAVLIEGIEFVTDIPQDADYPESYEPAHGYTMRGFGAGATVESADAATVRVKWNLHFEPGPSADREPVNAAIDHAKVAAKLDLLVVGLAKVEPVEAHVEYSQSHPPPTPLVDQEIPHADEETQTVAMTGRAADGFWGFSSFDFALQFDGACEEHSDCVFYRAFANACREDDTCGEGGSEPGDYLREIYVSMDLAERNEAEAKFHVDGFISNASRFLANYALAYDFAADVVWVPVGEATPGAIAEEFETGEKEWPLAAATQ